MKRKLFDVIACPKCFGKLDYDEKNQKLICYHDQLIYSIIDNIPVLLESEACPLSSKKTKENI